METTEVGDDAGAGTKAIACNGLTLRTPFGLGATDQVDNQEWLEALPGGTDSLVVKGFTSRLSRRQGLFRQR